MEYKKPATTFNQQLELLKSRKLIINDEKSALNYLHNISYYRLSAYFIPFKQHDEFDINTTFENIIDLYAFDRNIRLLILEAIEPIEVALRTQIIYHLSHKYGAFSYLKAETFSPRFHHAKWLHNLKDAICDSRETFILHYRKKYTESLHMPLWMALEVISFGSLSKLYRGLKGEDQEEIASFYGVRGPILSSWLHAMVYLRNLCAHHARLWNRTLTVKPQLPAKMTPWNKIPNHRIYCLFVILQFLLHQINSQGNNWKAQLNNLIKNLNHIPLPVQEIMGFPDDWLSQTTWNQNCMR